MGTLIPACRRVRISRRWGSSAIWSRMLSETPGVRVCCELGLMLSPHRALLSELDWIDHHLEDCPELLFYLVVLLIACWRSCVLRRHYTQSSGGVVARASKTRNIGLMMAVIDGCDDALLFGSVAPATEAKPYPHTVSPEVKSSSARVFAAAGLSIAGLAGAFWGMKTTKQDSEPVTLTNWSGTHEVTTT